MNSPGLRSVRRNSGRIPQTGTDKPLPPRLPSEARANLFAAGLRTCRLPTYSASQPILASADVSFRSCLPLRGSSGFSPDSLFTLDQVQSTTNDDYLIWCHIPWQAQYLDALWKNRFP